ncbi:MAG: acylneuraminate cytidylyltransferase family protein [Rhodospirillales bacterium]|nr:acylneuraminate cytidylyltransferase family protein [Rhodospirillales bacterium]
MSATRFLAIVPARGGSKGVPRKNLRMVGGRSLLARAIGAVRESSAADAIVVSTDDIEIAAAARTAGAQVPFMRSADLASDTATTTDVVRHALAQWTQTTGAPPEWFVLAEPTNPFRRPTTVAAAVARARAGGVASVIAVCPLERKPQYIFAKTGGLLERYVKEPSEEFERRQDMVHLCRLSNVVWVVRTADFLVHGKLLLPPVGYVEVDAIEAINIDDPVDLDFADFLARRDGA